MFLMIAPLGVGAKKQAFRLGRPAVFYDYTHNATNLPSGTFLIALCMLTYFHNWTAKI